MLLRLILRRLLLNEVILLHLELMELPARCGGLWLLIIAGRRGGLFLVLLREVLLLLLLWSELWLRRVQINVFLSGSHFDARLLLERGCLIDHSRVIDGVTGPNTQLLFQVRIMVGDVALEGHNPLVSIMQSRGLILKLRLQGKVGLF